ncbi:hypothetical protein AZE42_08385 [Rhizopogon vesiculosus]|uniref:Squalene monooxygenase n=1 Tax=Rhizopogon vesiculosus TaxID=180088 RepID=A0A1J8R745_9AGAM|nr:hypothetical protein AZE42_08385 [Rhizopogon vesiculosus]
MPSDHYDVLIVGAGVAGPSLAHALATKTIKKRTTPLRIALLERSLSKPDRIVAELLQPGGVESLEKLGIESCLDKIGSVPSLGFNVLRGDQAICAPFPPGTQGRSFDHGAFVMALRDCAREAPNVDVIEATVTGLIEDQRSQRVVGVSASQAGGQAESYHADLVILADGSLSKFRTTLLGNSSFEATPQGYFAGLIIKGLTLPKARYATTVVLENAGPIILFELPNNEYRMMVELKNPPPADLKEHILQNIIPQLPSSIRAPILHAVETTRIRRVPHYYLPPSKQGSGTKPGAFLLGDAVNMRHPLTAGGMTVALHDVVLLSDLMMNIENFGNWKEVSAVLGKWSNMRKPLASTINTMSMCWAGVFAGDSEAFTILQDGAFNHFGQHPEYVSELMSLAAGITHDPGLLAQYSLNMTYHAILSLFTQPQPGQKSPPPIYEYPMLLLKALSVIWTVLMVFAPVMWAEK